MTNSTPAFGSVSPSGHPIAHLIEGIEGAVGQQPLLPLHNIGLQTNWHRLIILAELVSRLVENPIRPWSGRRHGRRRHQAHVILGLARAALSSQQVEAVLDLLDQSRQATHANNISAADEVIVALSRSFETSGLLKATKETTPPGAEPLAEEFVEPMKVSAQ